MNNIETFTLSELEGAIPVNSISDITEDCRLFYELGDNYSGHWTRSGMFKEVMDVKRMIEHDKGLNDSAYLRHHNFMIIPNSKLQ